MSLDPLTERPVVTSDLKPLDGTNPPLPRESTLKPLDGNNRPAPREQIGTGDFRVGSRTDAQKLAGAIAAALLHRGGRLQVHAIGRDAVYVAIKAVAIARGHVAASAYNLIVIPGFEDIPAEDQTDEDADDVITGMVFVLKLVR